MGVNLQGFAPKYKVLAARRKAALKRYLAAELAPRLRGVISQARSKLWG